jgi:hypothetical protein
MVAASMLVTLLSESEIPQQILRAVITPAQRHLEALARVGGPADPAAAANDARFQAFSMREQLRRIERSILLLLASVVPGLGEREVEAHYAAERGAELRRQEQEQAQTQAQEQEQAQTQAQEQQAPRAPPTLLLNRRLLPRSLGQPLPRISSVGLAVHISIFCLCISDSVLFVLEYGPCLILMLK